jgi:hypothetical protein
VNLITVKTYSYDHETLLVEPKLKAAGIEYHLADQKTVAIDPLVSNAIGGIKLQVRPEDEERARALLAEIESNSNESKLGDVIAVSGQKFEKTLDECPKCDSEEVFIYKLSVLEGLFMPFKKRERYCNNCSHRWF